LVIDISAEKVCNDYVTLLTFRNIFKDRIIQYYMKKSWKEEINKNLGLYSILIVLVYYLYLFLYNLVHVEDYHSDLSLLGRFELILGPYSYIFLILTIIAVISIFIKYKYHYIIISLPFLWKLLLPIKKIYTFEYRGDLINSYIYMTGLDFYKALNSFLYALLPISIIVYILLKGFQKRDNLLLEKIFAVIIIMLLIGLGLKF